MTTVESPTVTPVELGGTRGGPNQPTLRRDAWWVPRVTTASFLIAFVVYASYAAFANKDYYVGSSAHRDLISPLYSPCLTGSCVPGSHPSWVISWWAISPALLILIFPLGFRLSCYYYRKAYYRSMWGAPPGCAVADNHTRYTGETRFPLIMQNVHRYFFWILLIYNVILTIDAVVAFRQPGYGIGISAGTVILCVNAAFLWLYSISCHACRHFCGGALRTFSNHPIRHWMWKIVTPLNERHMQFAWISLTVVALTDLYVRLVAAGVFSDPGFHF